LIRASWIGLRRVIFGMNLISWVVHGFLLAQNLGRCAIKDLRDAPGFGGIASAFAVKRVLERAAGTMKLIGRRVVDVSESGERLADFIHSAADP
jgi:hypothetical protein